MILLRETCEDMGLVLESCGVRESFAFGSHNRAMGQVNTNAMEIKNVSS